MKNAVEVPLLRKDFVVDEYQLFEAMAYGADCLLLICSILSDIQLRDYLKILKEFAFEPLVEVHDFKDLDKVLKAGCGIIGINNRSFETFKVDIRNTEVLRKEIPQDRVVVSESGISTPADIDFLKRCKVDAVLIGEAFMVCGDLPGKVKEIVSACRF